MTVSLPEACVQIARQVGMSYCPDKDGVDHEVVRLAETVRYTKSAMQNSPARVARAITEYLDDVAADP